MSFTPREPFTARDRVAVVNQTVAGITTGTLSGAGLPVYRHEGVAELLFARQPAL